MTDPIEESVKSLLSFLDKKDTSLHSTHCMDNDILGNVCELMWKRKDIFGVSKEVMHWILNSISLSYVASIAMNAAENEEEKLWVKDTISCFASIDTNMIVKA